MKNKVEDIIETLILSHFLDAFRDYNIINGGDVNAAKDSALMTLKNSVCLGSVAKAEVLKEELRMYLDFHAQKEGLLNEDEEYQKNYLIERDEHVNDRVKEILKVSKDIIRDSWN